MPDVPPERSSDEHPPLPVPRIPKGQYDPAFLVSLQANGQVRAVGDAWNGDISRFPPRVTHVIHPNGDLERIGMS